jgi:enoyl-CoA hydratase
MLGPYKARTMFFTGELLPASELHRLGAVEEVTPPGEAESRSVEFAAKLAAKSPIALRLAKESIVRIESMSLEDAYRTEQDYTARLAAFDDAREAMAAWVEKREPTWTWT